MHSWKNNILVIENLKSITLINCFKLNSTWTSYTVLSVVMCLTVSHKFPRETLCPVVFRGGGGGALVYNCKTGMCRLQDPRFHTRLPLSRYQIFNNLPLRRPRNDATPFKGFKIRSIAYRISWCVRTACRGRRSLVLGALARALV